MGASRQRAEEWGVELVSYAVDEMMWILELREGPFSWRRHGWVGVYFGFSGFVKNVAFFACIYLLWTSTRWWQVVRENVCDSCLFPPWILAKYSSLDESRTPIRLQ